MSSQLSKFRENFTFNFATTTVKNITLVPVVITTLSGAVVYLSGVRENDALVAAQQKFIGVTLLLIGLTFIVLFLPWYAKIAYLITIQIFLFLTATNVIKTSKETRNYAWIGFFSIVPTLPYCFGNYGSFFACLLGMLLGYSFFLSNDPGEDKYRKKTIGSLIFFPSLLFAFFSLQTVANIQWLQKGAVEL